MKNVIRFFAIVDDIIFDFIFWYCFLEIVVWGHLFRRSLRLSVQVRQFPYLHIQPLFSDSTRVQQSQGALIWYPNVTNQRDIELSTALARIHWGQLVEELTLLMAEWVQSGMRMVSEMFPTFHPFQTYNSRKLENSSEYVRTNVLEKYKQKLFAWREKNALMI